MRKYVQLQYQERAKIYSGLKEGLSKRQIARNIERHVSTVTREINRNADYIGYHPEIAQKATKKRKAKHGFKINRRPEMKAYILEKLKKGWSPVVVAGRWNREHPGNRISPEALYQYIYSRSNLQFELYKLLPRHKKRRGITRKTKSLGPIANRVPIDQRPKEINKRKEFGHFEGDLIFYRGSMAANVLTAIERKTRYAFVVKNESKHSQGIINALALKIGSIAKSITFDNGSEFAEHMQLTHIHGIQTYFCRPGAPWQKGSIEHFNGMTRKIIPFQVSPNLVTQESIDEMVYRLNHTPRKALKFRTPCEMFNQNLQGEIKGCCS